MLIIVFTSAFGVIMIRAQVPTALAEFLASLTSDGTILMLLLMGLWLVVGCFMAQTPAVLILTPILMPIAERFNLDLIHFGVVMSLTLTLGLLTPPVGMVLYALTRVTGLRFEQLAMTAIPYLFLTVVVIVLLIVFPALVTALPDALL
jgi:TRAP-type C4-dicarboxylate transport system permease large subunit